MEVVLVVEVSSEPVSGPVSYCGAFDIVVDGVGVILAAQEAKPLGSEFALSRAPFSVDGVPARVGNSGCN